MVEYGTYFWFLLFAVVAHYFALRALRRVKGTPSGSRSRVDLCWIVTAILTIVLFDIAFVTALVIDSMELWEEWLPAPKDADGVNRHASVMNFITIATPLSIMAMWFSFLVLMLLAFWGDRSRSGSEIISHTEAK